MAQKIDLNDPRYEEVDPEQGQNIEFKNEEEFNKYMEAQGNTRFLDPVKLGEITRAKLFGKYGTTEESDTNKAAKRGAAQSVTFGFADELEGGAKQLLDNQNYEQARDEARAENERLQEIAPNAYLAGEVVGGLATPVPGLGAVKGVGKTAAILGAQGAVQGLGQSEGETLGELASDAATGGAFGAGSGAILGGLPKGLNKLKSAFGKTNADEVATSKVASLASEAPEDFLSKGKRFFAKQLGMSDTDARIIQGNKAAVKALESETLPFNEKIVKLTRTLEADRNKFSNAARSVLGDEPKFTPSQISESFRDVADSAQRMNIDTGEMVPKNLKVTDTLNKVYQDLDRFGTLSEQELKDLAIKQIDSRINYNPVDAADNEANQILKQVRNRIDGLLKKSNKQYEKEMKQLAPREALLERLRKDYGLSSKLESGLAPTDKLTTGLKRLSDENKFKDVQTFKKLGELTGLENQGQDLVREARLRSVLDRNQYGAPQGSRNVNLGALVGQYAIPAAIGGTAGAVIGGSEGAAVGAVAGAVVDKSGRNIAKRLLLSGVPAKNIIDNAVSPGVSKISMFAGTEYFPILANAMKTGNYIATDFVLNTDPNYRKIKEESKKNAETE
jgi:hypothetical protein